MKKLFPILFFMAVVAFLFWCNYTPGTWLTGWDNLHPEFNFAVNIKRSFQAVWQEYQSMGLLGGMGHASDLPRQLFLLLLSTFIPQHLLRYVFHFLMLFSGSLGVYFFLKTVIFKNKAESTAQKGALLGGLFYLLNLGTIQYFFVPFEPYSTFWGLFPWEMLTLFQYLEKPTKKTLLWLILANILAIPQGYVQTIFFVYIICVGLVLATTFFIHKNKDTFFKCLKVVLVIFCVNAFWLLPNLYFVAKDVAVTQNAMQNKMATEKFFEMNKKHGNIADYAVLKEFYYDFLDFDANTNQPDFMMKVWRNHFSSPFVLTIGFSFFAAILFGLFQKNKYRPYLIGLFAIASVVFLSDTPIVSLLNSIFRSFPLVNQIFRNPFTKFIVPTVFIFATLFAVGVERLFVLLEEKKKQLVTALFGLILLLIAITVFPAWKGNFIAPQMRVKIPQEYFNLFDYFKHQDLNARIMDLPQGSYWGWEIYRWGVRGSGFLWYGIEQPIVDRAFDVWSKQSEQYFWELSYALQKRDQILLNNVLDKYQIQFVIYDENFSPSDNFNSNKVIVKQKDLLDNNPKLTLDKKFGSIYVYKVHLTYQPKQNITTFDHLPKIKQAETYMTKDEAYNSVGYYSNGTSPDVYYPYNSLFTNRFQDEHTVQIASTQNSYIFTSSIPKGNYLLNIPSYSGVEPILYTEVSAFKTTTDLDIRLTIHKPDIKIDGQSIYNPTVTKDYTIPLDSALQLPLFLSFNNKDFFKITSLSEEPTHIGNTYLSSSADTNTITIYSSANATQQTLAAQDFMPAAACGIQKGETIVSSHTKDKTLILNAKNTAVCSVYKGKIQAQPHSLALVTFIYQSSSDEFPQYCFYSQDKKTCLNNKDTIRTGFSNTVAPFKDYFEANFDKNDKLYFNMILEGISDQDKNLTKQIAYNSITFSSYPAHTIINVDNFYQNDTDLKQVMISSTDASTISVEAPKLDDGYAYTDTIQKNIFKKDALNYDTYMSGQATIEAQMNPKSVTTNAKNASSYMLFRGYDLSAGNGYLIDLKTKNDSGFPMTINTFTTKDSRNYIYTFLPTSKKFTSDYYILPDIYQFDRGINILLGGTSYNNTPSKNEVQEASIYPIPYEFMTQLSLQKENVDLTAATELTGTTQKKSIYRYEVSSLSPSTGVVMLSQSYHDGWNGYVVNKNSSLQNMFPYIFGRRLNHIEVNDWANGWQLSSTLSSSQKIVILFWPQYLEYLGFGLLMAPFILLLSYKKRTI